MMMYPIQPTLVVVVDRARNSVAATTSMVESPRHRAGKDDRPCQKTVPPMGNEPWVEAATMYQPLS
jgi:hypothetical protein